MRARRIAFALIIAVVIIAGVLLTNPLRWPRESVRGWLLRQAPVGSSFADVQSVIARHKWAAQEGWGGEAFRKVKGIHWLQAHVGDYRWFPIPVPCHVRAMWGFDDEKLVDIRVEKWCDFDL